MQKLPKSIKKIRMKHLEGKQVYPNWNLKQNISWFNVYTYPMGLIYGFLTLEWLRKKSKYMLWRLKPGKFWMPPVYATPFYRYIYPK